MDSLRDGVEWPFSNASRKRLQEFAEIVEKWRQLPQDENIFVLFDTIISDINYWGHLAKISEDDNQLQERTENLDQMRGYLKSMPKRSLNQFLAETTLASDVDNEDPDPNKVVLQTLHTAKGLEYPAVFIVGLNEGLLPHYWSMQEQSSNNEEQGDIDIYVDRGGIDEERRLFYVGITRCMSHLFLCYSRYGNLIRGARYQDASRFLQELPLELLETENGEPLNSLRAGTRALPSTAARLPAAKGLPEWARRELIDAVAWGQNT